jgi:hypothetical protein
VRWDWRHRWRYAGTVVLRADPDDPESTLADTSITRHRLRTRRAAPVRGQSGAPAPARRPAAPAPRRCNPNYEGACLPLTGDVDCDEIAATDIRVVGDDPFRLDGDGNGIGCES